MQHTADYGVDTTAVNRQRSPYCLCTTRSIEASTINTAVDTCLMRAAEQWTAVSPGGIDLTKGYLFPSIYTDRKSGELARGTQPLSRNQTTLAQTQSAVRTYVAAGLRRDFRLFQVNTYFRSGRAVSRASCSRERPDRHYITRVSGEP